MERKYGKRGGGHDLGAPDPHKLLSMVSNFLSLGPDEIGAGMHEVLHELLLFNYSWMTNVPSRCDRRNS